jgi:hypothetical protein
MGCPSTQRLLDFTAGTLAPAETAELEAHIDVCEGCRASLSELVFSAVDARSAARPVLQRGDAVARYFVIDLIGAGAMGVVYEAYDPELRRHVAI